MQILYGDIKKKCLQIHCSSWGRNWHMCCQGKHWMKLEDDTTQIANRSLERAYLPTLIVSSEWKEGSQKKKVTPCHSPEVSSEDKGPGWRALISFISSSVERLAQSFTTQFYRVGGGKGIQKQETSLLSFSRLSQSFPFCGWLLYLPRSYQILPCLCRHAFCIQSPLPLLKIYLVPYLCQEFHICV